MRGVAYPVGERELLMSDGLALSDRSGHDRQRFDFYHALCLPFSKADSFSASLSKSGNSALAGTASPSGIKRQSRTVLPHPGRGMPGGSSPAHLRYSCAELRAVLMVLQPSAASSEPAWPYSSRTA